MYEGGSCSFSKMSGHVGDLSPQQAAVLKEFQEKVKDVLQEKHDDYFLLRWLRARNFDLKKSEGMLREALLWRERLKVDTILEDFTVPEVLLRYRTGGIMGRDKGGSPIYIDPYGQIDMKGLFQAVKRVEMYKHFVYLVEKLLKICETETLKEGKRVEQVVLLYDLEKFGFRHLYKPAVDLFLEMVACYERCYPEVLKYVFVFNAPRIFPLVYNLVKPLLSEATVKKIKVLGKGYKEELLMYIDADQLPVCYGGTMTDEDGDPRCKAVINQGGTVPKRLYSSSCSSSLGGSMVSATIGRGSSLQLDFSVEVPNTVLKWEFQTDGYDIGFGVFRRTDNSRQKATDMHEIVATHRTNSHLVPEDGLVQCKHPGVYVIRFDNTYSWSRSKKVQYNIELLKPDDAVEGHVDDVEEEEDSSDVFFMAEEEPQEEES